MSGGEPPRHREVAAIAHEDFSDTAGGRGPAGAGTVPANVR